MRRRSGVADVIVPILTEAEFLTGLYEGQQSLTRDQVRRVIDALREFGPSPIHRMTFLKKFYEN